MTDKQKHWHEVIQKWSESGLSQADFCRQENIGLKSFHRWKHRLKTLTTVELPPSRFVELTPITPQFKSAITLKVDDIEILYQADTDPNLLVRLIQHLRAA